MNMDACVVMRVTRSRSYRTKIFVKLPCSLDRNMHDVLARSLFPRSSESHKVLFTSHALSAGRPTVQADEDGTLGLHNLQPQMVDGETILLPIRVRELQHQQHRDANPARNIPNPTI